MYTSLLHDENGLYQTPMHYNCICWDTNYNDVLFNHRDRLAAKNHAALSQRRLSSRTSSRHVLGYGSMPHSRSAFGQTYHAPSDVMTPYKTRGYSVSDNADGCYGVSGRSMTSLRTYDSGVSSVFYHSDNALVKHHHTRTASASTADMV